MQRMTRAEILAVYAPVPRADKRAIRDTSWR